LQSQGRCFNSQLRAKTFSGDHLFRLHASFWARSAVGPFRPDLSKWATPSRC
jgi:hypothetical protein